MAPKSLLMAGVLLLAGLVSPLTPSFADTAAATGSSTVGHELRDLGNPCNAVGHMGGIAANPAARQLFYSSDNRSTIFRLTYTAGFTSLTCTSYTWAAGATNGWTSLAWDSVRGVLWGWRTNTNELHRIALPACASPGTCAFTPTLWTTTGTATRGGLAQVGNDLYVAPQGGSAVHKHLNGAVVANVAGTPLPAFTSIAPYGARGLANFGGALFALDGGHNVFTYAPNGLGQLGRFWLHDEVHDSFHQVYDQGLDYTTPDLAFDALTFAPKGAVWILQESYTYTVICVANCQNPPCVIWAVNEAGQQYCVQLGEDPDGPNQYETTITFFPTVEAREAPAGPCTGPNFTCVCPAPAPAFSANPPPNRVHLRGQVVDPAFVTTMPVFFRGPATFVLGVANVQDPLVFVARDGVDIYGPGPATTHTLTFGTSDPLWSVRGQHTLQARVLDRANGCFALGPLVKFWVDDPTLWTHAQALRVEGNLPANLVLGTPAMAPVDDLRGEETSLVLDRSTAPPVAVKAQALCAEARHGLLSNPLLFTAEAHACGDRLEVDLDLRAVCAAATTNHPSCTLLPGAASFADGFHSRVRVDVAPLSTAWSSSDAFTLHQTPAVAVPCANLASLPGYAPKNGGCVVQLPGATLEFYQTKVRQGPLFLERTYVPLRVVVQQGPFQGEVVVGEVYAGISLGGRALLEGPPGRMPGTGDYGFPTDAPSTVAGAPGLANGLHSGSFAGTDTVDTFRVGVGLHQKVRVQLFPGHRVQATAMPVPDAPAVLVGVREYRLSLYDPLGNLRDVNAAEEEAAGPSVELNSDYGPNPGQWTVRIERLDNKVLPSTYGLMVSTTFPVLLPNEDAGLGDAPATCTTTKTLAPGGVYAGSLPYDDPRDVFALPVLARPNPIGAQKYVVVLTPLDPDGADLDLIVTDSSCTTTLATGTPADSVLVPKGKLEAAVHTGGPGDFRVHVVRANGVGSYTLEVVLAP